METCMYILNFENSKYFDESLDKLSCAVTNIRQRNGHEHSAEALTLFLNYSFINDRLTGKETCFDLFYSFGCAYDKSTRLVKPAQDYGYFVDFDKSTYTLYIESKGFAHLFLTNREPNFSTIIAKEPSQLLSLEKQFVASTLEPKINSLIGCPGFAYSGTALILFANSVYADGLPPNMDATRILMLFMSAYQGSFLKENPASYQSASSGNSYSLLAGDDYIHFFKR